MRQGGAFFGYKICYYRTFSCGRASAQARSDYATALEWLNDVVDMIRPGVTTRELAERWPPTREIWENIHVSYEDQTAAATGGTGSASACTSLRSSGARPHSRIRFRSRRG